MIAIVAAERHLYLRQSDGVMKLLDATPKGIVVKGHYTIPENQPSIGGTHPVIAGGRLYVRDDNKLLCYDIREDAPKQPLKEPLRIVFAAPTGGPLADTRDRILRSVFVPTPTDIVEKMLELANVKPTDVVCDLGSGDGRIVIAAAKKHGCKAVGYELDKDLVEQSRATAEAAGLTQLVTFEHKDLFTADLTEVDVLTVFLLPQQLGKLIPQIEKMKPGSRVISHQFEIPGIGPDTTIHLVSGTEGTSHALHLWTLPLKKAK